MKNQIDIRWYDEVDSTNTLALSECERLANLAVIAAESQTAGRGQRGNSWHSHPGDNLTFSIVVKFGEYAFDSMEAREQFAVSQAAALGVCDYLEREGVESLIKWPNDIYVRNRKICGMLIENLIDSGQIRASVIGIGLNVNQDIFPPHLMNPTSMKLVTGKSYSLKAELDKVCVAIVNKLEKLDSEKDTLSNEYSSKLFRKGVFDSFVDCSDGSPFDGKIIGVNDLGKLKIETKNGELKEFSFKEVSYVI